MTVKVGDLIVKVSVDSTGLNTGVKNTIGNLGNLTGGVKKANSSILDLAKGFFVGTVAFNAASSVIRGFTNILRESIEMQIKFDKNMRQINTIAKLNTDQFESLRGKVMEFAKTTPLALTDISEGLYSLVSALGYTSESMELVKVASDIAVGGFTSVAIATDVMTSVMSAYALKTAPEAKRAMDVLFKGVELGKFTFEELAGSIGVATAEASKVGVSLEEVTAAMVRLNLGGFDAANAATILSGVIRSIYSPSKEAQDIAMELGLEWGLSALQAKGLSGVLADMIEKTKGNQEAMIGLMGDARAIRGALTLASDGGKEYNEILKEMKGATGAVDDAVKEANKSWELQWKLIKNNVSVTFGQFVDAVMPAVMMALRSLAAGFGAISEAIGMVINKLIECFSWIGYNIGKFWEWLGLKERDRGMVFDVGARLSGKQFGGYISETGMYMLHAGERVEAQPARIDNRSYNINVAGGGNAWQTGRMVGQGIAADAYEASFR